MIKNIFWGLSIIFLLSCSTKPPASKNNKTKQKEAEVSFKENYRAAYTRYLDLVHTRLEVSFNWKAKELNGKEVLTLHPHFYPTDSVVLNAKEMLIGELALLNEKGEYLPLKFEYDSLLLTIHLDRLYTKDESLKIYIDYTSRPEKFRNSGSEAIQNNKGLYFINTDSSDYDTPTQVWTQGETEANSVWFPTVEDPQQKMTQEIYITVDTAFTTLSNGLLLSSINNKNGTKTDYWKQSLPAAPYLTMLAAGRYAVVKDKWKNIDVNYFVDPPYEKYAKMIFGKTPVMMSFFSEKLGVPFPWEKYSQIVVHDYVSGAMENTTAVVHGENMQQDPREFLDDNYEDYISHELFHHWFGDLVTCESWSNITLNEGFANYGEYLWREYKYGRDNADNQNFNNQSGYLYSTTQNDPPLIRFQYEDREDLYDAVSYNKGGRVLHMLRKYTGDKAFFESLHYYLITHQFGTAEMQDLRLAFEKTTGEDLNWFFNQWFMQGGHPNIYIDYIWNDSLKKETVIIKQKQDFSKNPLYKIPLDVDIYYNGKIERKKIIVIEAVQYFQFDLPSKPDLINVDAEKMLLCNKNDNKSNKEYIFQYEHAPLFLDRYEAVNKIGTNYSIKTPEANLIIEALNDKFYSIRIAVLNNIGELAMNDTGSVKDIIKKMIASDSIPAVREKALTIFGKYFSYTDNKDVIFEALKDNSYKVVARAFKIISEKDKTKAKELAVELEKDSGRAILLRLSEFYNNYSEDKTTFYKRALRLTSFYTRQTILKNFQKYLETNKDLTILSKGTDILLERATRPISRHYRSSFLNSLRELESSIGKQISTSEEEILTIKDSIIFTEKQAALLEMKLFKNKLHAKINAIEK